MRPMRSVLLGTAAILAFGALAPTVSAAPTPTPLHMTKDCGTFTGVTPSFCTVTVSNLDAVPPGSRVWYKGPVLTNSYFLSSNVTLDAKHGDTATGYCIFKGQTSTGLCTFWKGTGRLAGFVALVDVTIDATGLFRFDGMYYFADGPVPPDTSTVDPTSSRRHRYASQPS